RLSLSRTPAANAGGRRGERYCPCRGAQIAPGGLCWRRRRGWQMRSRSGGMFVLVLALAAGLIAAMAAPASPASGLARSAGRPGEGVPAFGHVFLIIGENTTYSHLTTVNAPYLMDTIRPHAAWLSNYYAATHWSQANYVALVTGQFTRCEQHDG